MKKNILIYLICALNGLNLGLAQCDYLNPIYNFNSEKRLLYGILPDYRNIQDSLFVDVYFPVGSTEIEKPLVIWAFGGGFFQGKREDFAPICEELAKRGIVSATIDYRIGFDGPSAGLNPPFSYDAAEIIRAGYRGATDMKGAIRFLKAKHLDYGIDLSRIWIGGASAGAVVALNAAYLDQDSEKPTETGYISPIGSKIRPDLGPIHGILNQNGFDDKIQGVFNFFGALIDTNSVSPDDRIAVFSYHQKDDPIVPCLANTPYFQIPFIAVNYPVVHGTCVMTDRFRNIGLDQTYWESWIYPGNQHGVHDETAVLNFMITQAKPFLCKTITNNYQNKDDLSQIYIAPNPATNSIELKNVSENGSFSLLNLSGELIQTGRLTSKFSIDISHLNPGIYFIKIQNQKNSKTLRWLKV